MDREIEEIQIGSKILIINNGGSYTTYSTFFNQNNLNEYSLNYVDEVPIIDTIYTVKAIGKHYSDTDVNSILVIEDEVKNIFLIENSEEWIRLIEDNKDKLIMDSKNNIKITGYVESMFCKKDKSTIHIYNKDKKIELTLDKEIADNLYCKNVKINIEYD